MLSEEDKAIVAGLEAHDQAVTAAWKKQDGDALFLSVGLALSTWAQMEESLVVIAGMLLRTKFTKAGAIMYSIINFNVWLGLIDELFVLEPSQSELKPKWNKISERLRGLKDIRDRLAHHTIFSGDKIGATGDTSLRPGRLDTRRKSQKYEPLNFEQISTFTHSISEVLNTISALINAMTEIVEREPLPQKSSEQDSGPNPP